MRSNENIQLLYIDLFCGAGGTSTGVENAVVTIMAKVWCEAVVEGLRKGAVANVA